MHGLLTSKQQWRRQRTNLSRRQNHDFLYQEGFPPSDSGAENTSTRSYRSLSHQSLPSEGPPVLKNFNKPWATTGNLQDHRNDLVKGQNRMKKNAVMFSARVNVILVPTIADYEQAGLAHDLWYIDGDYTGFKSNALKEVRNYMLNNPDLGDSKEAIKSLYQELNEDELATAVAVGEEREEAGKLFSNEVQPAEASKIDPKTADSSLSEAQSPLSPPELMQRTSLDANSDVTVSAVSNVKLNGLGFTIRSHSPSVNSANEGGNSVSSGSRKESESELPLITASSNEDLKNGSTRSYEEETGQHLLVPPSTRLKGQHSN